MEKILYIKANFKSEEDSYSLKLGRRFIESYIESNPNSHIKEINLYEEELSHLDLDRLTKIASPESNNLTKYVEDILEYDKYIIATPMWNFSIPSILKTYIDHIVIAGKTFKYTEEGPVGLLKDKKAIHITARGGYYSEGPSIEYEMGDKYLRTILGFIGVEDFDTLAFEGVALQSQEEVETRLVEKYRDVEKLAKIF